MSKDTSADSRASSSSYGRLRGLHYDTSGKKMSYWIFLYFWDSLEPSFLTLYGTLTVSSILIYKALLKVFSSASEYRSLVN